MKKLYFIMIASSIVFTGCNTITAKPETKRPKVIELNTSNLGIADTNVSKDVHVSYDANDEKEKLYNKMKRIENDQKLYKSSEFGVHMAHKSKN